MSYVPSSVKLPPMLKDISSSVLGRRSATIYPATGSIDYNSSNRLITFNISSEPALLDTDKLYFEFNLAISNTANQVVCPSNSVESVIDRLVLRVGSRVISDTGYKYNYAESMMHHFAPFEFSQTSGGIMGISAIDTTKGLKNFPNGATASGDNGIIGGDEGNNTFISRCTRFNYNNATSVCSLLDRASTATSASKTLNCRYILPFRLSGFMDVLKSLIPLWCLDSTISLSIDIYLASNATVLTSVVVPVDYSAGAITLAQAGHVQDTYVLYDAQLTVDYVDVSDDYKASLNSYLASGGVLSIPSSEVNIYEFALSSGIDQSFQLSAVYKDLEAIYIAFFSSETNVGFSNSDRLMNPNVQTIQLQVGSKYFPSDQPLDCTGRATRAFQQTAKAFRPDGIEGGFSFNSDAYAQRIRIQTLNADNTANESYLGTGNDASTFLERFETPTYFVVGFPFESLLDEDENTITGLDTSSGSGVITIRVKFASNPTATTTVAPFQHWALGNQANSMIVVCKFKQSVNVQQNYSVDRML